MKEHTEDYSLFYKYYDKILKCIESCTTENHLYSCHKMTRNFEERFRFKQEIERRKFKLHYDEIRVSLYVKEKMLGLLNP